jgi:hypothetical protein
MKVVSWHYRCSKEAQQEVLMNKILLALAVITAVAVGAIGIYTTAAPTTAIACNDPC